MTDPVVPNLSIVVPAFNEGANITPVVREIVETIAASPWVGAYEVVLVNDGSTDDTGAVMDRLKQELPQLRVFHHEVNRGFGAGLRTGFSNSRTKQWRRASHPSHAEQVQDVLPIHRLKRLWQFRPCLPLHCGGNRHNRREI